MVQLKRIFLPPEAVAMVTNTFSGFKGVLTILVFTITTIVANHPSHHGHNGGHHHMHHQHHHAQLAPPTSSSAPLSQTYVHKYSYSLPGSGSYFSMSRLYSFPAGSAPQPHLGTPTSSANVQPFLPNFVGPEQVRSSAAPLGSTAYSPTQIGQLKDNALLSSLSFLPDILEGADSLASTNEQSEAANNSSSQSQMTHTPFNPRFAVGRLEVTDEEWQAEMLEDFETSGLIHSRGKRGILTKVPKGLVNINFGTHTCVHMGTVLRSSESAYPPTAISYPIESAETSQLHTIIMVDLDHEKTKGQHNDSEPISNNLTQPDLYLHWMVVNIPGSKVDQGQIITSYKGPAPKPGTGAHRYVIVAFEQKSENPLRIDHGEAPFRTSFPCQETGRTGFDLDAFRSKYNMSEHPIAANYFQVENDEFVENIDQSCAVSEKQEVEEAANDIKIHALPILNSRFL